MYTDTYPHLCTWTHTGLQHTHACTGVCSDSILSHAHRHVSSYIRPCTLPLSMDQHPGPCIGSHSHSRGAGAHQHVCIAHTQAAHTDPGTLACSTQTRPHCAAPHAAAHTPAHTHTLAPLSANCWCARGEGEDEAHDSARKRGAGGARAGEEMTARGPPRVPAHEY